MRDLPALNRFLVLPAICLLAGCVHFHPRPLLPAPVAAEFEARSLRDAGLRSYLETNLHSEFAAWPPAAWDLTNLTLAGFYFSPDLDVARAKWAVATAGKKTAAESPNPSLSVLPSFSTTTPVPSPWLVTPLLDIPIETAGKRGYRIAQSSRLSEAARLNIALTAWQVRSKVRRSLLDLFAAMQTRDLLKEQLGALEENVKLIENQYNGGAVPAFELTQARMAVVTARMALHDADAQSAGARVQLADAIGLPVAALADTRFSFAGLAEFPAMIPATEARRRALSNRADILGALAEYAATESALQLEIAKQYPDLHLNPGYEYDQGNNKWSLGFTVTLPLVNQNQGPIAEAQAQRAASAANFNALQARVVAEIDGALAAVRLARQKQEDADALLSQLQKQLKTYQGMFEAGEISKTELTSQRLQSSTVALARLDALVKAQQAIGQLEDALQTPLGVPAAAWQAAPRISQASESHRQP